MRQLSAEGPARLHGGDAASLLARARGLARAFLWSKREADVDACALHGIAEVGDYPSPTRADESPHGLASTESQPERGGAEGADVASSRARSICAWWLFTTPYEPVNATPPPDRDGDDEGSEGGRSAIALSSSAASRPTRLRRRGGPNIGSPVLAPERWLLVGLS
jgi:hypothetical protein